MFSDTFEDIEIQIIKMRPTVGVGGRDCAGVILKDVTARPGTRDPRCEMSIVIGYMLTALP